MLHTLYFIIQKINIVIYCYYSIWEIFYEHFNFLKINFHNKNRNWNFLSASQRLDIWNTTEWLCQLDKCSFPKSNYVTWQIVINSCLNHLWIEQKKKCKLRSTYSTKCTESWRLLFQLGAAPIPTHSTPRSVVPPKEIDIIWSRLWKNSCPRMLWRKIYRSQQQMISVGQHLRVISSFKL